MPEWWDHVVVAALATLVPWQAAHAYRQFLDRIRAGLPDARAREYRSTLAWQWALTGALVALWWQAGRTPGALGFGLPVGARLAAGAAITAAALALLYTQWRAARRLDRDGLEALRAQMAPVAEFLPRTPREASLFRALSITAGICEEVAYRGYLIWYLAAYVHEWIAVALAAAAFGLVHFYQGMTGAVRTGAIGLGAGALYAGTGTLLWPVILHAAIDLHGGAIARHALAGQGHHDDTQARPHETARVARAQRPESPASGRH